MNVRALKLNDLWIERLLFDLNYKFIKIGASLLALAKSIYYFATAGTVCKIALSFLFFL